MNRRLPVVLGLSVAAMLLTAVAPAWAQLSREQLEKVRKQRTAQQEGTTTAGQSTGRSPTRHLHSTIIDPVEIDSAKARDAFRWWSDVTGIPLVINWREMEAAGIDPDMAIDLHLRTAPAVSVLSLLMKSITVDQPLLYEVNQHYIRIMTKAEADKDTITLVYDIKDLITTIPNFPNAPSFDLNSALSNTSSGGSSGGPQAATNIFSDQNVDEVKQTDAEKGEEIANLIRELIEPTIWQELGGQHSSVKYFHGRLIVKAPRYVHAQIGIPVVGGGTSSSRVGRYTMLTPQPPKKATDIAGVRPNVEKVAGVAAK